jgi:hypothetical protein
VVPEAVVVQNHGKNGLWTPLDDDCRLYACAPILPRFLYVGDIGSQPWPHYHQVSREVVGRNSMHNSRRVLYECTLPNRINPDSPLQQWDGSSPRMASERYSGLGRMRMK